MENSEIKNLPQKIIIYQVLPRLFGNSCTLNRKNGTVNQNGCGKLNDFTPKALRAVRKLGATHIWYTGVIRHATKTSYEAYGIPASHPAVVKGEAGSPYAISDYYDIDPDLAEDVSRRREEFTELVTRTHSEGLKVIIDFVPNHVARQYKSVAKPGSVNDLGTGDNSDLAFSPHNNFYYLPGQELEGAFDRSAGAAEPYREFPAKVTGNDCFNAHPTLNDWYETVKLNYGVDYQNGRTGHFGPLPGTWLKMLDILLFWARTGIDGFRCDMAEMVPVEFWAWVIPKVKEQHPGVLFIAEVYNPAEYRNYLDKGKFDYLYDKVGLYDTLRNVICQREPATAISRCWQSLEGLEKRMLNFLENHDEQRLASDFFAGEGRKGIPGLIVSALMNTNPFMIYSGQELGEKGMDAEGFSGLDGRTTIFDYWSVETLRNWKNGGRFNEAKLTQSQKELHSAYERVLAICNREKAVTKGLFFDLMYVNTGGWSFNEHRHYAFMRKQDNELLLVIANFSPVPAHVAINIPAHAFDFLQLAPRIEYEVTDLLSGKAEKVSLLPYQPTETDVDGYSGKILKFQL